MADDKGKDGTGKPGFLGRLFGRGEIRAVDAPDVSDASPAAQTKPVPERAPASPEGHEFATAPADPHPERPGEEPPGPAEADLFDARALLPMDTGAPAPPHGESPPPATPAPEGGVAGWWGRLRQGLARTSSSLGQGITDLVTKRRLDEATLEELEDILVGADLGVATAQAVTEAVGRGRFGRDLGSAEVKEILAGEVERVLRPVAKPLAIDPAAKPFVILMVGVNGSGKTTTIGKLAAAYRAQGRSVMLAAGDTFRAAAVEQLKVWGERTGARVVAREQGADAAGLAFDALREAREGGVDLLLVDTAGRLQNKAGLMAELEKIVRVLRKADPAAPHAVLLVLDATVGQNALSQVELFGKSAGVTGLVMTKLDGTARGGILVALAARFGLPVHHIGVGEGVDDLAPFEARDFARAVAGLEQR